MNGKIKIFIFVMLIIFSVVFCIKFGVDLKYKNDYNDIISNRFNILENFEYNKKLAEEYLRVYEIVDNDSYKNVKDILYDKFSYDMRQMIFPTANYTGLELHPIKTEVIEIIGTNNGYNKKNTFFITYKLSSVNYDEKITNLIDIEQGLITRVIRIK